MLDLGTLNINVRADVDKAKSELEGLQDTTENVESTTSDVADSIGKSWDDLGGKISGALGALGVSAGLGELVSIASETQEDMGKLSTAFEQVGYSAETANGVYKDFVGLLGETDTAVEASNHLARLCNNEEELAQWTDIAAGVYATFGDSLPLESLTEAANETAQTGTVTGALADALNWAGINEDDFNARLAECNGTTERAAEITRLLSDTYSDVGENYRDNNADLIAYREAQAQLNETLSEMGMEIMPVFAEGMGLVSDILSSSVMPWLERLGDAASSVLEWFNGLDDGVKDLIGTFGEALVIFKPVQSILNNLSGTFGNLVPNVKKFFDGMADGKKAMDRASDSTSKFSGWLDLAAMGISLVISLVGDFIEHENEMKQATDDVVDAAESMPPAFDELSESVDGSTDSVDALVAKAEESKQGMIDFGESLRDSFNEVEDNGTILRNYVGVIEELAGQSGLTAEQQTRLKQAVDGVNDIMGTNYEVIDSANGVLNASTEEIKNNTQAWYDNARAQAAYNGMIEAQEQVFTLEAQFDELMDKEHELNEQLKNTTNPFDYWSTAAELWDITNQRQDIGKQLDAARDSVDALSYSYENCASTISQFISTNDTLTGTLQGLGIDVNAAASTLADFGLTATDAANLTADQLTYLVQNAGASAQEIANQFAQAGWQVPESMREMLTDAGIAIDQNGYIVVDAAGNVATEAADNMDKSTEANAAGSNTAQGYVDGVNGKSGDAGTAGAQVGNTAATSMDASGTAAQSGANTTAGYAGGVAGQTGTASSAGSQVGSTAANAMDASGEAQGAGTRTAGGFTGGVRGGAGQANSAGRSVANSAQGGMQSNSSSAGSWGSHLVENFAAGIRGAISWVTNAANAVASTVSSILGHTIPKEGILSNNGKGEVPWGEHLVQNIAQGMLNAKSDVEYAAEEIATAVMTPLSNLEAPIDFTQGQSSFNAYAAQRAVAKASTGTTYNYFIGDTKVDTITQQRFAEEFIQLMDKYGRLAVT